MLRVAFVRGRYLNNFEGQNYVFERDKVALTGISSLESIHEDFPFDVVKLPSIVDLERFGRFGLLEKVIKYSCNRILGDSQILFGLENLKDSFDIFHSADPHYYYTYQLARLRAANRIKRLVITSWETISFNNESVYKKQQIKRYSQRYADLFICYTHKAKQALIEEGIPKAKIKVIKLGVDLSRFKPQGQEHKDISVLFVGRLVDEKGIMDLYEAFKGIRNAKLRIIGEGPLKFPLKELIRQDGLADRVKIEMETYDQMHKVYQRADLFVLPSKKTKTWEEQYGVVLVEAMASGLPVVAYATGAIPEVLGNVGILVKEGDIGGLTASIIRIISDKNVRTKLGKMGRERAEREFDRISNAQKIKKIYENLCSNNNEE